jgi:hypothetical protein
MSLFSSILPPKVQAAENRLKADIIPATNTALDVVAGLTGANTATNGILSDISGNQFAQAEVKGKAYINSQFPDEVEYYACAVELVDSSGNTQEFFSFPVLPSSMSEAFQNIATIKKTNSGVVVNKNDSFIPFNLNITGDFGRRFRSITSDSAVKAIAGNNNADQNAIAIATQTTGNYNAQGLPVFDADNKTGYGSTKILERIMRRSLTVDSNNKPFNLYFYNLAFNSAYNVEVQNFTFSQSKDKNMIWSYNIAFRALCLASTTNSNVKSSLSDLRSVSAIMNEGSQQSSIIGIINTSTNNNCSPVEQILYGITPTYRTTVNKLAKTSPVLLNAINNVINLAKDQNTIFLATLGNSSGNGLQRFSALRQTIAF